MFKSLWRALAFSTAGLCCFALAASADASPHQPPQGIYVKIDISDYVSAHSLPTQGADADMITFYDGLLQNQAVSGLALQVHWDWAQPYAPPSSLNWDYINDAFTEATAYGKTIQLIVTAGFNSPMWVWDWDISTGLPSCDPLFSGGTAPNCGTVSFSYYDENTDQDGSTTGLLVLPLPWNPTYISYWHSFLEALRKQYGDNAALVSLSMAGPTAASAEMIMPNNYNTCPSGQKGPCLQANGWYAEDMWNLLFTKTSPDPQDPFPQNSDEAFIKTWHDTIKFYEEHFHNITLVITPGAGTNFPSFGSGYPFIPTNHNVLYDPECDYSDTGGPTYVPENYATRSCDARQRS
jgi:hypothetical protein